MCQKILQECKYYANTVFAYQILTCNMRRNHMCVHFYVKYCWCRQFWIFPATCASEKQASERQASSGTLPITSRYNLALEASVAIANKKNFGKALCNKHLAPATYNTLHVYLGHTDKTTGGCKQLTKNEQCEQLTSLDKQKQVYHKLLTSSKNN